MNKQKEGFVPILIVLAVIGIVFLLGRGKLNSTITIGTPVPTTTPTPLLSDGNYHDDEISFSYNPNLFYLNKQVGEGLVDPATNKKAEFFKITSRDNKYSLIIKLNMYGIGGGCPDFPQGYNLSNTTIDGVSVFKAQLIDKQHANENWPLGNIYLVQKLDANNWECPNVAGLHSSKNGAVWVQYDLSQYTLDSQEYKNAQAQLNKIVSSIKNLWQ